LIGSEEIAFADEQKRNAREEIAFADEQKRNAREQFAFPSGCYAGKDCEWPEFPILSASTIPIS